MLTEPKNEEWKDVTGFEGRYKISNHGRCESLPKWHPNNYNGYWTKGRLLRPKKMQKGYAQYELSDDNSEKKTFRRSRLVAIHFIPNPENKEQVNHKDGDRWNDYFENLEWNTQAENIQHSYDFLGRKAAYKGKFGKDHNQSIAVKAIKGKTILSFESKTACGIYFGVTPQNVCRAIKNNGKCAGFKITIA